MRKNRLLSSVLSIAMTASCAVAMNVSAVVTIQSTPYFSEENPMLEPWNDGDTFLPSSTIENHEAWRVGEATFNGEDASGLLSTGNTWKYSSDVVYIYGSEEVYPLEVVSLVSLLHAHALFFDKDVTIFKSPKMLTIDPSRAGISQILSACYNSLYITNIYGYKDSPLQEAYEEYISNHFDSVYNTKESIREKLPITFIDAEEEFIPEFVPDNPYYSLKPSEYKYYPEEDMLVFSGGKLEYETICEGYYAYTPSIIYVDSTVTIGNKSLAFYMPEKRENFAMHTLTHTDSFINTVDYVDGKKVIRDTSKNIRVIAEYGSDAYNTFENDVIGYYLSFPANASKEEEIRSRYNFEVADDSEAYAFLDKVRVKDSANSDSISILENESISLGETTSDGTVYGDVSGNGKIDIIDAVQIMSYDTNSTAYPLDDAALSVADVYNIGDGVNNMDALAIQNYLTNNIG